MLSIHQFIFSLFGENTYLLIDQATKEAAVIDPGMQDAQERNAFDAAVERLGAKITQVINTHMHLDHCFGANYVTNKYGVLLKAHPDDKSLGLNIASQASKFALKIDSSPVEINVELKDGDIIDIGESKLEVIHVPGHSAGSIALYWKEGKVLFAGDTLFRGSVGRTDLLGGDHKQLINSIKTRLLTLPDDTVVYSGHGNPTTIGQEKRSNPYLAYPI